MKRYSYKSKTSYMKHLNELMSSGFDFPSQDGFGKYVGYYDEYIDFILVVHEGSKQITYGSARNAVGYKIKVYGKSTNKDNY